MEVSVELTLRIGCLLALIAACNVAAIRLRLPDALTRTAAGMVLGTAFLLAGDLAPAFTARVIQPLLSPALAPAGYLWLFLPPILFQAALEADAGALARDILPILVLAIGAVFAATLLVGLTAHFVTGASLAVCLLVGAIVSTTDPSAVIELFRSSGVPARMVRLVEGESLLNDAAAIALASHLTARIAGQPEACMTGSVLGDVFGSLLAGGLLGALAGMLLARVCRAIPHAPLSRFSLSLALPNLLYPIADLWLHVSGVVTVVAAGLTAGALLRRSSAPDEHDMFRHLWRHLGGMATGMVFLLAAMHVPGMLRSLRVPDLFLILAVLVAALLSRWAVLGCSLPLLSRIGMCAPLPRAHRLVITWGGVRGPVTLVLALCAARAPYLPPQARHLASAVAVGFVLANLACNGLTLRPLVRRLGIGGGSGRGG
ncbi:cation:proton antiporter [Cupriavidus sp. WKF15]|uniref:cation:proton antiporter n=1 Tax=Cupriavidus sp. WKF15 TaxID=3032282 RepID=UPI0023E35057|nr:cation:proton antiporter [Cupriavidus sp. WKF15]WER49383.1 cation:proton antiporter [Cupriavidus sp. WKF15]